MTEQEGLRLADGPEGLDGSQIKRLLDQGWSVVLFKNDLGSYTAAATIDFEVIDEVPEPHITDDFSPEKALHRLARKALDKEVIRWQTESKEA